MELGQAFTYIFKDKRWFTKLLIGWLVSIVPILNFAFTGYVTRTIRNVEINLEEPLPEWDNFGEKFVLGFYMWLASIIYALPIILLSIIFFVPVAIVGNNQSGDAVAGLLTGAGILFSCLALIYALVLSLLLPAMNINLARKETFSSVFDFSEFWRIFRANTSDYLVAWIMTIVWAVVIGTVGGLLATALAIIPCIGWIAAFVLGGLLGVIIPVVYAHLFGQVAAKDRQIAA